MFHTPITSALASSRGAAALPRTLLISPLLSSLPTYLTKKYQHIKCCHMLETNILLRTEAPRDLVVEDVEEEGVVVKKRNLLLLHDLHCHRGEDCLELGKDDVPHYHFSRPLLIPHLMLIYNFKKCCLRFRSSMQVKLSLSLTLLSFGRSKAKVMTSFMASPDAKISSPMWIVGRTPVNWRVKISLKMLLGFILNHLI